MGSYTSTKKKGRGEELKYIVFWEFCPEDMDKVIKKTVNMQQEAGKNPVRIRVKIVESKVAFYVDDTLMCIFKDPLAGKAGKPGFTSESTSYAQSFRVRRTK